MGHDALVIQPRLEADWDDAVVEACPGRVPDVCDSDKVVSLGPCVEKEQIRRPDEGFRPEVDAGNRLLTQIIEIPVVGDDLGLHPVQNGNQPVRDRHPADLLVFAWTPSDQAELPQDLEGGGGVLADGFQGLVDGVNGSVRQNHVLGTEGLGREGVRFVVGVGQRRQCEVDIHHPDRKIRVSGIHGRVRIFRPITGDDGEGEQEGGVADTTCRWVHKVCLHANDQFDLRLLQGSLKDG